MGRIDEDISVAEFKKDLTKKLSKFLNKNSPITDKEKFVKKLERAMNSKGFFEWVLTFFSISNLNFRFELSDAEDEHLICNGVTFKIIDIIIYIDVHQNTLWMIDDDTQRSIWIERFISVLTHELIHVEQIKRGNSENTGTMEEDDYYSSLTEIPAWAKDAVDYDIEKGGNLKEPLSNNPSAQPYRERPYLWDKFMNYYRFYAKDLAGIV